MSQNKILNADRKVALFGALAFITLLVVGSVYANANTGNNQSGSEVKSVVAQDQATKPTPSNPADDNRLRSIAERMWRGELVTAAEKAAAYETYLRLIQERQPNPPSAADSTGGPDAYGYRFFDSNEPGQTGLFNWITHTTACSTVASTIPPFNSLDDGHAGPDSIGFSFPFYGRTFTNFYPGTNGRIEFNGSYDGSYYLTSFPLTNDSAGVFFWNRDMHIGYGGTVIRFENFTNPTRLVITYDSLSVYNQSGVRISCQIVLYQDGRVLCQYRNVNTNSTVNSIGIQNRNGTSYLTYTQNGAPRPNSNTAIMFYIFGQPSSPVPSDSTGNIARTPTLSWTAVQYAAGYDILLDSNTTTPTTIRSTNQAGTSFTPSWTLQYGTNYVWQVVARGPGGAINTGPIWHFTTARMNGTYYINPDTTGHPGYTFPTFAAATNALATYGVSNGGVTFLVYPGTYNEMVTVSPFTGMGMNNPVTFIANGGTVNISPTVSTTSQYGVKLNGCQYITFNGINVIDASTAIYPLYYGYWVTNADTNKGAQNNTVKNATIRLRISSSYNSFGIYQYRYYTASSYAGSQCNNRYLNLKISKAGSGVYFYGTPAFPDYGNEIGSDSAGVYYANRFVIGAMGVNDTIGGQRTTFGLYAYNQNGIKIHDIDVCNLKTYSGNYTIYGLYLSYCNYNAASGPTLIYNNRIYNLTLLYTSGYGSIYGIYNGYYATNNVCRIYNNMIYNLQQTYSGTVTSTYYVYGIREVASYSTIINNTIVLKQNGTQNYSSACYYSANNYSFNDTLRNNIFANLSTQTSSIPFHVGAYNAQTNGTYFLSDNNNFYIPDTTGGYVGYLGSLYQKYLTSYQHVLTPNCDLSSTSGNPLFIDSLSNPHIRIGSCSPVGNAGAQISWNTTDIDGESRASGQNIPDVGADEGQFSEVSGIKTIGGTNPDFPTFNTAITTLSNNGLGNGGVIFQVRPGNYPEFITVPWFTNSSASNPVTFVATGGTVTVNPMSTGPQPAITLRGCQYVTFDGINVSDPTTALPLNYGYYVTNASSERGAQHNTIKNATIRMRIYSTTQTYGIFQNFSVTPLTPTGTQSYNRYLNLKISKALIGVNISSYYGFPDIGTEIGSDSVGLNYANRFTIGAMANDTIGGANNCYGIYASYMNGISIHDVDITNLKTFSSGYSIYGIYLMSPNYYFGSAPTLVYNNRVYNLQALHNNNFTNICGIWTWQVSSNGACRIYNNMIYNLQQSSTTAATPMYYTYGIFNSNQTPSLVNNTIVLTQSGNQNFSSSCLTNLSNDMVRDTILNNVFVNNGLQSSPTPKHVGLLYSRGTRLLSDYNCFYVPNSLGGALITDSTNYYTTLASWRASVGSDYNSISKNPFFIDSLSDPHIRTDAATCVESRGTPVSYVTTDIDGNPRNTSSPDLGADEGGFTPAFLDGTKTIGGTNPDYATFGTAIADLSDAWVGDGGVTFLVRPGSYPELITIPAINRASAANPITFRATGPGVNVNPTDTSGTNPSAITLFGSRYVTFDSINVIDPSTGANYLTNGYLITNADSVHGAQYNTIKNASIRMRKDFATNGVCQTYQRSPVIRPFDQRGNQSYNRYLNLKISKAQMGLYIWSSNEYGLWDTGIEIGSDSVGLNYPGRFVIGALTTDTIGGPTANGDGYGAGIYACYVGKMNIHDIDVRNVISTPGQNGGHDAIGISIPGPQDSLAIYNCRVYNIVANSDSVSSFKKVTGISTYRFNTENCHSLRIYNNMIYDLYSIAPNALPVNTNCVTGIFSLRGADIMNNTILINTLSAAISTQNYTSTALHCRGWAGGNYYVRNNIIANLMPAQTIPYHMGVLINWTGWEPALFSDNNCFYIPNTNHGVIGQYFDTYYPTLADWFTINLPYSPPPDTNSVFGDPNFVRETLPCDPHLVTNEYSIANQNGVPYSYINTDIDGSPRNPLKPDIGADEGNFAVSTAPDVPVLVSPVNASQALLNPILFRWMRGTRNHNFDFYLSTNINDVFNLSNSALVRVAINDTFISYGSLTAGQIYYWRIVARDSVSFVTTPSLVWRVTSSSIILANHNGGENVVVGIQDTIRWTYAPTLSGNVELWYNLSYPNGRWERYTLGIDVRRCYYVWNPWSRLFVSNAVRVAISPVGQPWLADTSDANFAIVPQLSILYPNGGDTLRIGQQDLIRWRSFNLTGNCTLKINRSYPTGEWTMIAANVPISMGSFPFNPSGVTNLARIAMIPNDNRAASDTSDANFSMVPHTLTVIHPDSNQQVIASIPDSITWNATFSDTVTISMCRYGMDYARLIRIATRIPSRAGNNAIPWTPDTVYTDSARILIEDINDASTYAWSNQVFRIVPATISVIKPVAGLWKYAGLQDTIIWSSRSAPTVHLTDSVAIEFRATQTYPWQQSTVLSNNDTAYWIPPAQGTSNAQIRIRSLNSYPTVTSPGHDTVASISPMFTVAYWPWSTDPYNANNPHSTTSAWSPSIPFDVQTDTLPPLDLHFGLQTGGHRNPGSVRISYSTVAMDLPTSNVINRIWNVEPDTENFTGATLTLRFTSNLLPVGITRPDTVTPPLRVFSSDDGGSTWIYVPGSSNCYRDTLNDPTGNTYKIDVINLNSLSKWAIGNGGFRPSIQFPSGGEVLTTGAPYTIRWTRSLLGDSVGVYLNRNYPGAVWESLGGTKGDSLVWTATGTASTSARIRVQSILFPTDCDTSPNNFTIRVPGDFNLQPTPTIPVLSVTYSGGNANLSWTASSGIVTGYKVYRSSTTGHFLPPSGTLRATILAPTTTYQDLGASGHYYYRVTAYNALSSDIAPVVTPPEIILPPTNVDAVRRK